MRIESKALIVYVQDPFQVTPPTPISRSPIPPLLTRACGWVFVSASGIHQSLKNHTLDHFYCPFLKLSPHFHSLADT